MTISLSRRKVMQSLKTELQQELLKFLAVAKACYRVAMLLL